VSAQTDLSAPQTLQFVAAHSAAILKRAAHAAAMLDQVSAISCDRVSDETDGGQQQVQNRSRLLAEVHALQLSALHKLSERRAEATRVSDSMRARVEKALRVQATLAERVRLLLSTINESQPRLSHVSGLLCFWRNEWVAG
jgi:hypothetical protein